MREPRDGGGTTATGPAGQSRALRLRVLRADEAPAAAAVLARAFADEPAKLALFPEEASRRRLTEVAALARVRALVRYAAAHGVEIDGTLAGVALWRPPNVRPGAAAVLPLVPAVLADRARVVPLARTALASLWNDRHAVRRFAAARSEAAKAARSGQSWYLELLATDPRHQRRGVARRLLERTLGRCDVDGLPVWLETTRASTAAMYERFGFRTVAAIRGGGVLPDLWVMRREPR